MPIARHSTRRTIALWCACCCLLFVAGCLRSTATDPERPLVIVASGDTAGWIIPCGCTSNQSGGLLRRGTYLREQRAAANVIYADVGGAASGTSPYDRARFEAILSGELALGIAAHNVGLPEAQLGAEYLRSLASRIKLPLVSANVRDAEGQPLCEPLRIVTASGRRVALVGVLSDRAAIAGMRIDPPREAVLSALAEARGKYDSAIVLAYLDERELLALAAELPEADLVIGGPTGQSIPPQQVGPTLVASATNKGKFLASFRQTADRRTPAWAGEIVEMTPALADDARQQQNLKDYYALLAQRDFAASQTSFVEPLPPELPESFRIAGTTTCQECHADECATWKGSGHARSWESLSHTGAQVDSFCQRCHVNGYGMPGGFVSAAKSTSLTAVGCESCHGPSHAHAQNSDVRTTYFAQAAHQCVRCHDRENSPEFAYDGYWPKIEHGRAPQSTAHAAGAVSTSKE